MPFLLDCYIIDKTPLFIDFGIGLLIVVNSPMVWYCLLGGGNGSDLVDKILLYLLWEYAGVAVAVHNVV